MVKTDFMRLMEELDQIQEETTQAEVLQKIFKFENVLRRLESFKGHFKNNADYRYWRGLRAVCWDKAGRRNQDANKTWQSRFITFCLPYIAEKTIIENSDKAFPFKLKAQKGYNVISTDSIAHANEGSEEALEASTETKRSRIDFCVAGHSKTEIECKSLGATTSVHGAKYVIRHTPLKAYARETTQELTFFLTGTEEDLAALFEAFPYETSDGKVADWKTKDTVYVLAKGQAINSGFNALPVSGYTVSVNIIGGIQQALNAVEEALNMEDGSVEAAAHFLDTQERVIDKATDSLKVGDDISKVSLNDLPDAVEKEINDLKASVDDLAKAVKVKYKLDD